MGKVRSVGTKSRFFCTCCGREGIPIQRKKGSEREAGHLKQLYCIYCKKEVNHAEVREIGGYTIEDFKKEYLLGRFVNGVRVSENDLLGCSCDFCEYNINGKCWNSNNSYSCKYRIKDGDINE